MRKSHAREIEEAIAQAEELVGELVECGGRAEGCEAAWLDKMAQALRMALVADLEPAVLTRLHLRLETAVRRASALLAEHEVDAFDAPLSEEVPASQRPTFRPPPPPRAVEVGADGEAEVPSQRPTVRPVLPQGRVASGFIARVDTKKRESA